MLTRERDLRTGHSVWEDEDKTDLSCAPLTADTSADVMIVGAGISGAMIADALTEAGLSVVVADRRPPLEGSTTASTALLQYEIDTPLINLREMIGEEDAVRAWRRARLALDGLGARLRDMDITEVTRRDSLYLAGNVLDADGLKAEGEARRSAGIETRFLDADELKARFGIERDAALLGYDNLAVDPRQMAAGFLEAAAARGARIFAPTVVSKVEPEADRIRAITQDGPVVTCRHLVLATGYELPFCVPTEGHSIASTWAIATVPQPQNLWPEECFVWEASDPYLYMRTTPDGRIICGGEDEDISDAATRDTLMPAKTEMLRRKLKRLFPQIDTTVDFAWSGAFGLSDTGLPHIGEVPGMPGCWSVLGFGGNGITYSRIASEILRAAFTGHDDPDTDLYAFKDAARVRDGR